MEAIPDCTAGKTVQELGAWLNSLAYRLPVDDPGYDEQTEELSLTLRRVREAARDKPPGCSITSDGDDSYECRRCGLDMDIRA